MRGDMRCKVWGEKRMKKINNIMNMVICLVFGLFLGVTYDQYKMYLSDSDFFAPFSAPWYMLHSFPFFLFFVAVTVICVVIKIVIHKRGD